MTVAAKSLHDEIQQIKFCREHTGWARDKWLRRNNWEQTCQSPGSYWMWKKEIDGETFLVDSNTAERIQEHLLAEQDYKERPEEYEE